MSPAQQLPLYRGRRGRIAVGSPARLDIGLALSGGGVRAAVFHLGVLARLAEDQHLENIRFVSTVSGGSLVTALVYALSRNRWPASGAFRTEVLPAARQRMTTTSLKHTTITRSLWRPWLLVARRAALLAESLEYAWGIRGELSELSPEPRWIINATTFETRKNWRFESKRMGDYDFGYVAGPSLPISVAAAASAAYPALVGSLILHTKDYQWYKYERNQSTTFSIIPEHKTLHLYDGGIYDNLGVEALFKANRDDEYRPEINFLLVSDASAFAAKPKRSPWHVVDRLVGIPTDQVRGLRSRSLVRYFGAHRHSGAYLRMGRTADYILGAAGICDDPLARVVAACLPQDDVNRVASTGTNLDCVPPEVFDPLCRHGWEVADCTLHAWCPDMFSHRPWAGV